jgi:hypothetical protein
MKSQRIFFKKGKNKKSNEKGKKLESKEKSRKNLCKV